MQSYLQTIVEGVQSTFGYFLFGSFLLVPILALVVLIIWIAGLLFGRRQWNRLAIDSVTFLVLVFIVGAIPNFLFDLLLRSRWYYTVDPLIAFLPFFPSIELAVDSVCGGRLINGITPIQFYLEWFFAAVATWSTAAVAYRRLTRNRRAVQLGAGADFGPPIC